GETDSDAANSETGDETGDVYAEIVEDEHQGNREQRDADQQPDDPGRGGKRTVFGLRPDAMFDIAEDQLARPNGGLEGRGNDKEEMDQAEQRGRGVGMLGDQLG